MSSDISSILEASESLPEVNELPLNFLFIMDITKDQSNTKTGDKTIYTCTVCQDKGYDHKANAASHTRNSHPGRASTGSASGTQRSISAHFRPIASEEALQNAFNPQAYQEALISILTRRRMPFFGHCVGRVSATSPRVQPVRIIPDGTNTFLYPATSLVRIHDFKHSILSTITGASFIRCQEIVRRAPENICSGSAGVGGIERISTTMQ
ncbi:hypothetical protein MY3296_007854 [Beauveria thailandica]